MKFTELKAAGAVATSVAANTMLLVCQTPDTDPQSQVIDITHFANSFNQVGASQLALMPNVTPANSVITSTKGVMFFDTSYLYVATANNTLKRVALSAF